MFNFDGCYFWKLGVQIRYVTHFKDLINAKMDLEAQGRDSIFTFGHAQLKKGQVAGLFRAALYKIFALLKNS